MYWKATRRVRCARCRVVERLAKQPTPKRSQSRADQTEDDERRSEARRAFVRLRRSRPSSTRSLCCCQHARVLRDDSARARAASLRTSRKLERSSAPQTGLQAPSRRSVSAAIMSEHSAVLDLSDGEDETAASAIQVGSTFSSYDEAVAAIERRIKMDHREFHATVCNRRTNTAGRVTSATLRCSRADGKCTWKASLRTSAEGQAYAGMLAPADVQHRLEDVLRTQRSTRLLERLCDRLRRD